jgi:hypothetical protein
VRRAARRRVGPGRVGLVGAVLGRVVLARAALVVGGLLAGTACARPLRPSGSGGPATDVAAPVAAVGAERVTKAELSDFLHARFREAWLDALDELVDERIVTVEARALGVTVSPRPLAAVEAEVEARRRQPSSGSASADPRRRSAPTRPRRRRLAREGARAAPTHAPSRSPASCASPRACASR